MWFKGDSMKRKWADQYGSRWYLHYDGRPPHDEDQDYYWTGSQWVSEDEREKQNEIKI